MFSSRRRTHTFDIWPGFVDALSALLMVIIFVLMTFVLSQIYLSYALSTREKTLAQQDTHIAELLQQLRSTLLAKKNTEEQLTTLKLTVQNMQSQQEALQNTLQQTLKDKAEEAQRLTTALAQEQISLNQEKLLNTSLQAEIKEKTQSLKTLEEDTIMLKKKYQDVMVKVEKTQSKTSLSQFQSEFLSALQKVVGQRSDIRVVGDRFVFQSEIFFDIGSAELGAPGKDQLTQLAKALKEIAAKIPANINWILRIDGHTDHRPIKTKFPSNWELSAARALAVVRFLILQGIAPDRLVAAGFGEFQPLIKDSEDEKELARNRRIEFRLDQR